MSNGLRKVVHIEVFDFDNDTFAYAIDSKKNQFGYKYKTQYYRNGQIVREDPEINNVEKAAYYYNKLGINLSQLRSLRKKIKELSKHKMIPFPTENGVEVIFRGGSNVHYNGEHPEEFYQKVLKI